MKAGKDFTGIGVGVLILNEKNQILLGLRNEDPDKADSELHGEGTWTMPGGKMDFLESPLQCAKREVKEETGMDVDGLKIISVSNDKSKGVHFITLGFFCNNFQGAPKTMELDEIVEWRWFELNKLPAKIFFPSKKVLDNYINKKIYSDS